VDGGCRTSALLIRGGRSSRGERLYLGALRSAPTTRRVKGTGEKCRKGTHKGEGSRRTTLLRKEFQNAGGTERDLVQKLLDLVKSRLNSFEIAGQHREEGGKSLPPMIGWEQLVGRTRGPKQKHLI